MRRLTLNPYARGAQGDVENGEFKLRNSKTGFLESIILSTLVSAGVTGTALGLATTALTAVASVGLSLGLSYLASSLFRPSAPKPEDMQQSTRQPTQPRTRHYGRVKISGPWVFAEAKGGGFHKVLALGQGRLDAIEQYWIDDTQVTLDASGWCQTSPWDGQEVRILTRLGDASQSYYSELGAQFPEWTSDHRGDGVASLYAYQDPATQENYLERYPNGIQTNYRVVARGARVTDIAGGGTIWSDNAANVIRDYLSSSEGMRMPISLFTTTQASAGWAAAYTRAAEAYALKGGGAENRYRLWGSYTYDERPADVIGRMLDNCDGRLVPTSDGGLTLDIGDWQEPTVTIDADAIVGFSELGRGRDILTTANTVRATFLDPEGDYQAADADPWIDAADVSERGEIATDKRFEMSPSHSQCRRLMKLAAFRANPSWTGTFQCNLRGLAAFGERFVRIQYPLFSIDEVMEIQDFRFDIGEGGILTGVTLQVQSMPQAAYTWDADQESGDAPVYDDSEGGGVPTPDAPTVDILPGPVAELSFSPPPAEIYSYQARYKPTAGSTWTDITDIPREDTSVTTATLDALTEYEFQMRLVADGGRIGEWSVSTLATTP